jgi:hypothetical protein
MVRARLPMLMTALIALAILGCTRAAETTPTPHVGPIPKHVPFLRDAFALGTLTRIDPVSAVAEFKLSCGWYYAPRRKLRPGLWKVRLRGLTFAWAASPARSVASVSLAKWERRSRLAGWSGSLRLRAGTGNLSNGPTTDICAGVAG